MKGLMLSPKILHTLSFLLILMAICHANVCMEEDMYFGNWLMFSVQIAVITIIYMYRNVLCLKYLTEDYKYVNLYLRWTYILSVIGFVVADNYIEYRQLFVGIVSLLVPVLCWLFCRPTISLNLLSAWYKYAWLPFLFLFYFKLGFTQFYMQPILVLVCLFPLFPKKTAMMILLLGVLLATKDIEEERAPFIKATVAILTGIAISIRNVLPTKIIRIGRVFCFFCSVIVFVFVFGDAYDVFVGKADVEEVVHSNKERDVVEKDTRSLLYIDVVTSAIDNEYLIWGRTPARGFDITYSGVLFWFDKTISYNKNERHKNEMVLSNILTWEGLVGLLLFSLIYIRGSYLAVYRSNNKIIPILGCFIAWRWSWGWVEDANNFLITDVDLWALIAICYSSYFRRMSDGEFIVWANGLLSKKHRQLFQRLKIEERND